MLARILDMGPTASSLQKSVMSGLASLFKIAGGISLVAEHFDAGPAPIPIGSSDADVTLGSVEVESLEVERLRVAGEDVTAKDVT